MKRIRLMLGFVMVFGALFVVLPGWGRLFEQDAPPVRAKEPCSVYACILTAVRTSPDEQAASQRIQTRESEVAFIRGMQCITPYRGAATDANGNVVTSQAYYKCVPEAFAPGDAKT